MSFSTKKRTCGVCWSECAYVGCACVCVCVCSSGTKTTTTTTTTTTHTHTHTALNLEKEKKITFQKCQDFMNWKHCDGRDFYHSGVFFFFFSWMLTLNTWLHNDMRTYNVCMCVCESLCVSAFFFFPERAKKRQTWIKTCDSSSPGVFFFIVLLGLIFA